MNIDTWKTKKQPCHHYQREEYTEEKLIDEFEQIKNEIYNDLYDLTITLGNLERIITELKNKQLYITQE